jgi:hypothetical protein
MLTLYNEVNDSVQIELDKNHPIVQEYIIPAYKHLQNIPLNCIDQDFGIVYKKNSIETINLLATKLDIEIDNNKLYNYNQDYLNQLHQIFEENIYSNQRLALDEWLIFHESIHSIEECYQTGNNEIISDILSINHRTLAGPLSKKFDIKKYKEFLLPNTTQPGLVTVDWCELGKKPYRYWLDKEPDNIERIKQLCKPWLTLYPKLDLRLRNQKRKKTFDIDAFNNWWDKYSKEWCSHYNLDSWTYEEQNSCFVIGKVTEESLEKILHWQENNFKPNRIKLDRKES